MSESSAEDAALLIQYLNGELLEQDSAALRTRLESDHELRASLALIEAVRAAEKQASDQFGPTAFGWNKLKKAIANETRTRRWYHASVPGWQAAAAAIVVGFAGWQMAALSYQQSVAREPAGYTPAGSPPDSIVEMKIAFIQDAPHSAVESLLRSVDAQITAGPSALGFYTIEFKSVQAREAALVSFAEKTSVVAEIYVD